MRNMIMLNAANVSLSCGRVVGASSTSLCVNTTTIHSPGSTATQPVHKPLIFTPIDRFCARFIRAVSHIYQATLTGTRSTLYPSSTGPINTTTNYMYTYITIGQEAS